MTTLEAILSRRTLKVLVDPDNPWPPEDIPDEYLKEFLLAAEMAPFHYPCHRSHREGSVMNSIVPWRFYGMNSSSCRSLLSWIRKQGIDSGKIAGMLAAAGNMQLVTWLPGPPATGGSDRLFEPSLENMEHIAATSAAIQNLLIAATARDIPSYWSSGGILREDPVRQLIGIPSQEILLGAIFLFPAKDRFPGRPMETIDGKLRSQKGPQSGWSRGLELDSTIMDAG